MKNLSVSEAKMKLSTLVEEVQAKKKAVLITKNGAPAAVLMSHSAFDSWKATMAVCSDAALMREIIEGLTALKAKKCQLYTLQELFKD